MLRGIAIILVAPSSDSSSSTQPYIWNDYSVHVGYNRSLHVSLTNVGLHDHELQCYAFIIITFYSEVHCKKMNSLFRTLPKFLTFIRLFTVYVSLQLQNLMRYGGFQSLSVGVLNFLGDIFRKYGTSQCA